MAVTLLVNGAAASAATVQNVRAWSGPEGTRVVFELSGPAEHRAFALSDPDRIVIDLAGSSAASSLRLDEPKGAVTALRTGSRPGGELRLVLELNQAAKPKTFLLSPNDEYGFRLVVDLPPAQAAPVVRRAPPQTSTDRGRDVVIVIDAGHGGDDPGASGRGGAREKDVVLAIAKKLAAEVDSQDRKSVV